MSNWKVIRQSAGRVCALYGTDARDRPEQGEQLLWEGEAQDNHDAIRQWKKLGGQMTENDDFRREQGIGENDSKVRMIPYDDCCPRCQLTHDVTSSPHIDGPTMSAEYKERLRKEADEARARGRLHMSDERQAELQADADEAADMAERRIERRA